MTDLELPDARVGILAELYWYGYQKSRSTFDLLYEDIECLIDAGLIEEFQRDMTWWGKVWFVRITEQGVDVLKNVVDPLRVFDLLLTVVDSLIGASAWVMMFDLAQLPAALTYPNEQIREAAEVRLMEIENRVELSDDELLQMMQCYRAVVARHQGWVPSRVERRLALLGLLRATRIADRSFWRKGVSHALNLTDKGARFLEDHHLAALVEFLIGCLDGGSVLHTFRDSYHMNRLLRLFESLSMEQLPEFLTSDVVLVRDFATARLGRLRGSR